MNKKRKKTTTKIISRLIIFVFVISLFQLAFPTQAATTSSMSNLYSNPNQSSNTYKFKISDIVNPGMLTSVVGCTGVINKVSTFMASFIQSPAQAAEMVADQIEKGRALLKKTCSVTKAAAEITGQSIPTMPGLFKPIDTILSQVDGNVIGLMGDTTIKPMTVQSGLVTSNQPDTSNKLAATRTPQQNEKICQDSVDATDPKLLAEASKQADQEAEANFKTQCLDGIAITLAKNQLTAMTRSAMNWVNSGYGGNPFFVQSMTNLTNNIELNVLETGTDILLNKAFGNPYASDFARSAVTSYNSGSSLRSGATNFLGNLTSDLGAFITDPKSYYTNSQLNQAQDTRSALQRAQDANNAFANDFSTGGWNGWLALTQRDQNNPLGFAMQASDYLADQQAAQIQGTKDEVLQNNGFLSQKKCVLWKVLDEYGSPVWDEENNKVKTTTNPRTAAEKAACADLKVITPGSLIKDKISNYLDSPDRQLELAKTINDSLNALFSVLISKLEIGGLSGLSDSATDAPMNWTDNINTNYTSLDGNTPYNNNGAYGDFNLTRDLGNTYIYTDPISLGNWDAKNNCVLEGKVCPTQIKNQKKLYPDNEIDADGKPLYTANTFYTVIKAGNTKLINEGYNGWAVGDRAFWDGRVWQNWKKGQANPIKQRGVIQIQQDYIVAAQQILGILPKVMTSMGELDYCIPGPNLSYQTNSTDAQSAYQNWIGTINTGPNNNSDMSRLSWTIDRENSTTYKTLANIFGDNPNTWKALSATNAVAWFLNYFGPFPGRGEVGKNAGIVYYSYDGDEKAKYTEAQNLQTINTNYVNNNLFQNFYNVFSRVMHKVYFDNMTSQYLNTETSINTDKNPAYVPMAQAGLDLTKNITYYNNDTAQKIQDYTDRIAQAKINIAKLEPIKTEVSTIIKAAQDRRTVNMIKILNEESVRNGTPTLTEAQYKVKYAECLNEENIQVFDPDTITKGSATENCTDVIDNDLNGLVDMADPVCWPNGIKPNTIPGRRQ